MNRAWLIPVLGVALAPLVTWWPMLALKYPELGMPRYHPAQGIDLWSAQMFWFVAMGVIAVVVGNTDRWLGVAVALAGLTIFWRGATLDPTHSVLFALGAVMLVALRRTPAAWHPRIKSLLVGLGVFQLLYVIQQWAGYDLLWGPLVGGQLAPKLQPLGTLGTVDAAGAYLALTAPLMPLPGDGLWAAWNGVSQKETIRSAFVLLRLALSWSLIPAVAAAVWYGHSAGALGAFVAGLTVKMGLRYGWRHRLTLAAMTVGGVGFYWLLHVKSPTTIEARFTIWQFVARAFISDRPDLTTSTARHLVGLGLGGWQQNVPTAQLQMGVVPYKELWREAHSEPLQWIVETGLVGLLLLGLWLYAHRAMFLHPVWGGSLAALSVNSLTFFPLHVVQVALVALILVGLATSQGSGPRDSTSLTKADSASEWGGET